MVWIAIRTSPFVLAHLYSRIFGDAVLIIFLGIRVLVVVFFFLATLMRSLFVRRHHRFCAKSTMKMAFGRVMVMVISHLLAGRRRTASVPAVGPSPIKVLKVRRNVVARVEPGGAVPIHGRRVVGGKVAALSTAMEVEQRDETAGGSRGTGVVRLIEIELVVDNGRRGLR